VVASGLGHPLALAVDRQNERAVTDWRRGAIFQIKR